jgi:hypothetical protein
VALKPRRAPGLQGSAQMENPTKARTATLRTIIAIAATSMVESRLAMRQFFRQSNDGVDLGQAVRDCQRVRALGRRRRYRLATCHRAWPGSNAPVGSSRITRCRQLGRLPTSA